MNNVDLITSRRLKRQIQRISHVFSPHVCAEFPRDDVAAVIVQDRAEIEPTPAQNLEIREVGLPELVDGRSFVFELICRLDDDEGGAGDQVMGFQHPVC